MGHKRTSEITWSSELQVLMPTILQKCVKGLGLGTEGGEGMVVVMVAESGLPTQTL